MPLFKRRKLFTSAGVCNDPRWHYEDGSLRWGGVPYGMTFEEWDVEIHAHRDTVHGPAAKQKRPSPAHGG